MKKAAIDLTTKSLFAVFLVIFASIIISIVFSTRYETMAEKVSAEQFTAANDFFVALLSNPDCFATGGYEKEELQKPAQAVLSIEKIKSKNRNADLTCINNFKFIYNIEIQDLFTNETIKIGPELQSEQELSIWMPVVIRYWSNKVPETINPGIATLTAYFGDVPSFYGLIKEVCAIKDKREFKLYNKQTISYTQDKLCVDEKCFVPAFRCRVTDFTIPIGEHIVLVDYKQNSIEVKI